MAITADESISILKAVMYGTPKELVPELQTPGGMRLYEKLRAEYETSDKILDIPSDDPDLTGVILEKVVYEEK